MDNMLWVGYAAVVLIISGVVGMHLGRFRAAYTEHTGMMVGMTMGMLNGFLLGYAAGAMTDMFQGNIAGMLLGLASGAYFGRAGSLMGVLDGAMGGVMGGSMGAMLAVMLFHRDYLLWTALLLGVIYVAGILGLVLLIEKSAPDHAALHRLMPMFTQAVAIEAAEEVERIRAMNRNAPGGSSIRVDDYYDLLGVRMDAADEQISASYLARLATAKGEEIERLERAIATLSDARRRTAYDRVLNEQRVDDGRGDCCPPRKVRAVAKVAASVGTGAGNAPAAQKALPVRSSGSRGSTVRAQQPVTQEYSAYTGRTTKAPRRQKEAPISWVGIVAGIAIVGILAGWWAMSQGAVASPTADAGSSLGAVGGTPNAPLGSEMAQRLEPQAVVVAEGADGKQTLDFVVSGHTLSYEPKVIKVKQGKPVRFNVRIDGPDPGCHRFIAFPGMGISHVAKPGEVTAMEFTPTQTGVFEINCTMNMTPPSYMIVTQ